MMKDEIDLKELFLRISDRKWLIIGFIFFGLILSTLYSLSIKKVFKSEIDLGINFDLPHTTKIDDLSILENFFYKKSNFDDWNKNFKIQSLSFSDISRTYTNGDNFFRKKSNDLEHLLLGKDDRFYRLVIFSNDIKKIKAYYDYLKYTGSKLKESKINELIISIDLISQSMKLAKEDKNYELYNTLDYDKRKLQKEILVIKEEDFLNILSPIEPKLVEPVMSRHIFTGSIIGLIFGFFVFFLKEFILEKSPR